LVRALLPSQGASLNIEYESEGYVRATLDLMAPVLFLERDNPVPKAKAGRLA